VRRTYSAVELHARHIFAFLLYAMRGVDRAPCDRSRWRIQKEELYDLAPKLGIARAIHLAHASDTGQREDLVGTEAITHRERTWERFS
jgi:hypothetical protein